MKAMSFHEYGDAGVLHEEVAAVPEPGPGEVRVRVAASAFNPADAGIRGGYLRDPFPVELPHIPGYDVSGTVDAVGDGVTWPAIGDEVVGFLSMTADGGAAQFVTTPVDALVAAPASVPLVDAAALSSPAVTAWQALVDAAGLISGQRILINGAGGAVGGYATQLAKSLGAYVIAATRSDGLNHTRLRGADEAIDHSAGPIELDEPVDVLLNLGGIPPEALAALTGQVRDGGVVVNTVPAIPTPGDPARNVRGVGFFVRPDRDALADLVSRVDRGELVIDVAERVGLDELAEVHARSDAGTLRGKVVVVPPAV